jgi:soluble lytic murein transglycosylase-like protein
MRQLAMAAGLAVLAGAAQVAPALADRLQPDFTFRRIGVPPPGTDRRITVQIDPNAPSRIRAPDAPRGPAAAGQGGAASPVPAPRPAPAAAAPAGMEWFWSAISPRLSDSRPGRLEDAVALISTAPEGRQVAVPRVQNLQEIARAHGTEILRATVGTRVSPALVLAVIAVESAGRADAVSRAGAQGLMQLMPATAQRFGVTDSLAADQNIRGGVAYLDWLMEHFNGDPILVLAGYNAGEGAVRDNAGVPPFAETRAYVPRVIAAWQVARRLCQTPPQLMTDGCVFAVNNL